LTITNADEVEQEKFSVTADVMEVGKTNLEDSLGV
jgi:hypothetical protein